ncbi:hypothetical protein [Hymenobacter sp. B81]|uniref:hypothetical protein n=1 Tax=Hymenobacter sp. B81 TaxID=3344878 RepID=UPI0037DC66F8
MKWKDAWGMSPALAGALAVSLLLTDCFGGRKEYVTGLVEGRDYTPAYTTQDCSTDNKGYVSCHTTYHEATYSLLVRSAQGLAWVSTSRAGYSLVHDTDVITYSRRRTKWTNYTWCDTYSPQ